MSTSPDHLVVSINPAIRNMNIRQISKMIATKIIETTALQIQFNSSFCQQLGVAGHLNTYEAIAYFTDNQYFEKYGFNRSGLITMQEVYNEILSMFYTAIQHE
ncbi:hypothetical protein [Acinetobacter pittii]|uniref:hypothetical protein n=1 Tax=Acinetobacter pittii TaxID=48296 RepID=UPI0005EB2CA1|nr:hypothetical protein [Acinetobacter pittii]RZH38815.1 hypothetical protein EXD93_11400 [Acinetobacter pittii]